MKFDFDISFNELPDILLGDGMHNAWAYSINNAQKTELSVHYFIDSKNREVS